MRHKMILQLIIDPRWHLKSFGMEINFVKNYENYEHWNIFQILRINQLIVIFVFILHVQHMQRPPSQLWGNAEVSFSVLSFAVHSCGAIRFLNSSRVRRKLGIRVQELRRFEGCTLIQRMIHFRSSLYKLLFIHWSECMVIHVTANVNVRKQQF